MRTLVELSVMQEVPRTKGDEIMSSVTFDTHEEVGEVGLSGDTSPRMASLER